MKLFNQRNALSKWVRQEKMAGKSIGFVPTMGALHAGHIALIKQARSENNLVVCSVFVNPVQFNKAEDLKAYPRTLDSDLAQLEQSGCDAVFCPEVKEIYPEPETRVYDFGHLDKVMEGRFREGHFNGVAIVVNKLLNIVEPHRAYFGEKDFQQLQVVRALARMEGHDVEIVSCPTVRESDGLALSSRNVRLTEAQRKEAPKIYQALQMARDLYPDHGVHFIKENVTAHINRSSELTVEYFEIVWADNLLPVDTPEAGRTAVACIAVYAGPVRLIDNLTLYS